MNRDTVETKISELLVQQVAIEHQLQGLRRMHDSAVLLGQQDLATQYREQIHAAIDMQLDSANSTMLLTRQLTALK